MKSNGKKFFNLSNVSNGSNEGNVYMVNGKIIGVSAGIGLVAIVGIVVLMGVAPSSSSSSINNLPSLSFQQQPKLVDNIQAILPERDDLGTELRIGTPTSSVWDQRGFGNMSKLAGFEEGIEQNLARRPVAPNILTIARFDTTDNAAIAYNDFKDLKIEAGGFKELKNLAIDAECLGIETSAGGGLVNVYNVHCTKSNIYYHVRSTGSGGYDDVVKIAQVVGDKI